MLWLVVLAVLLIRCGFAIVVKVRAWEVAERGPTVTHQDQQNWGLAGPQ